MKLSKTIQLGRFQHLCRSMSGPTHPPSFRRGAAGVRKADSLGGGGSVSKKSPKIKRPVLAAYCQKCKKAKQDQNEG